MPMRMQGKHKLFKTILSKKNNAEGIIIPDTELRNYSSKSTMILQKNQHVDQ